MDRTGSALVALLALTLIGAACGQSSYSSAARSSQPTASASGSLTLQQGAGGFVFSPPQLTVKQGDTVSVSNVGTAAHTFTVSGQSIDITNDPGQTTAVTVDLPPGSYPFICRFHAQLGMRGTLTVAS